MGNAVEIFTPGGQLAALIGNISGQPWGGAGYTIPVDTYGIWARRAGLWLMDAPDVIYSMYAERVFTSASKASQGAGITALTAVLDETLPFGNLVVPSGRVIVPYVDFYSASLVLPTANGGFSVSALSVKLLFSFFASLNGAGAAAYAYLTGPVSTGMNTWSAVKFRCTWTATFTSFNWSSASTYQLTRNLGLRIFNHSVHALPSVAEVSFAVNPASIAGRDPEGGGSDPGGGSGTDTGGAGGDTGGGGGVA
jgi:hypothetical protein